MIDIINESIMEVLIEGGKLFMIGIYFSGTGNSRYILDLFLKKMGKDYKIFSIEDIDVETKLQEANDIVIAYPIYYSSMPKIMDDFLEKNIELFRNKKVFIITTMGLFSGDGCGLAQRKLRKVNANIIGGIQVKMPDNICDSKLLKKDDDGIKDIICLAEKHVEEAVGKIKSGQKVREGLSVAAQFAGCFAQRLYFGHKVKKYSSNIKIDRELCVKCGKCIKVCPMKNLEMKNELCSGDKCTMCYRCINICSNKALTLLGRKVGHQYLIDKYII